MTHFAKIEDNVVVYVIVAEQDYIDNHAEGTWVQTSYNTRGGVHYGQDRDPDDGVALNKNFAGAGSIYVDGVGFHAPMTGSVTAGMKTRLPGWRWRHRCRWTTLLLL